MIMVMELQFKLCLRYIALQFQKEIKWKRYIRAPIKFYTNIQNLENFAIHVPN